MGEAKQGRLSGLTFNRSVVVEARPERLSDSGGALLVREALERTGVVQRITELVHDPRDPDRITHPQAELLTTFITLLALGWKDQDDADALRDDPLLRLAVSERAGDSPLRDAPAFAGKANPPVPQGLASQPTLSRLLSRLASPERLEALREGLRESAARRIVAEHDGRRLPQMTLDFDGLPVPVEGHQPGSAYNGYFHGTVYHPLVTTCAELGDMIALRLRPGNAHAAQAATDAILQDVRWAREHLARSVSVRLDAGMPSEELLAALEGERIPYVARLRNNPVLDRFAAPHLRRPPGRPPKEPRLWFVEYRYRAQSWSRERRVVLVVLERPGELFLHHFWLLTSWREDRVDGEKVLERYRRRGTAEGHFGELKDVLGLKLSSAPRGPYSTDWRSQLIGPVRSCDSPFFRANDALLQLCALAYNAMHALRRLVERAAPNGAEGWSLRRLRERVLRVAARVTLTGRRVNVIVTDLTARYWAELWKHWRLLGAPALAR
jgi:hypothetical protein